MAHMAQLSILVSNSEASRRYTLSATLWARGMGTKSEMITLSGHLCMSHHVGNARWKQAGVKL